MPKLFFPHIIRKSPELLARARRYKSQAAVDRLAKKAAKKKGRHDVATRFSSRRKGQNGNDLLRRHWYGREDTGRKKAKAKHLNRT